jgi:hypothetical protein
MTTKTKHTLKVLALEFVCVVWLLLFWGIPTTAWRAFAGAMALVALDCTFDWRFRFRKHIGIRENA